MINYGLAQISRAYGQSAKSQTRAVAVLLALARVKNCYNPHPLWLGFIVVWIHCGLARISRAYGQRAKLPMRAVAALLTRVKIYYNPHPYGLD